MNSREKHKFPQRLKPHISVGFSARPKPCPDETDIFRGVGGSFEPLKANARISITYRTGGGRGLHGHACAGFRDDVTYDILQVAGLFVYGQLALGTGTFTENLVDRFERGAAV